MRAGHPALSAAGSAWLAALADPLRRMPTPDRPMPPQDVPAIVEAAGAHGIVPAAATHIRMLAGEGRASQIVAGPAPDRELAAAAATLGMRLIGVTGQNLMLLHHARRIAAAFAEARLPAAIVKGPVFARRLYPDIATRSFTDIDMLVAPSAVGKSAAILQDLGFVPAQEEHRPGRPPSEFKWLLPGHDTLLVEVQTDLIHSPSLGAGIRLDLADVMRAGGGDPEDAAALLLVAAVHGIAGHQLERMQPAVDVLQAVRGTAGPIAVDRLVEAARACGASVALHSALDLVAQLFAEPAAAELSAAITPAPWRRLRRRLLTPAVVLRAQASDAGRDSWRRQALREIVGRTGPRPSR